jgi:hypothetical protein
MFASQFADKLNIKPTPKEELLKNLQRNGYTTENTTTISAKVKNCPNYCGKKLKEANTMKKKSQHPMNYMTKMSCFYERF